MVLQSISLGERTWSTTLPHRVVPHDDEWLPGLLLRSDEVNHWASRTTLSYLLSPGPEKFHRSWRTGTPNFTVIPPFSLNLDFLAQALAISTETLLATTYHRELARLYGTSRPHSRHFQRIFSFHLCPACFTKDRRLLRTLALPHITLCTQHQVVLQKDCTCGAPLSLFHRSTLPFMCHLCGKDWATLPRIEGTPERLELEQKYRAWYDLFFSQGTLLMVRTAFQLIDKNSVSSSLDMTGFAQRQLPLGTLIPLLVQRGRSPQGLLTWMDQVAQQRMRKRKTSDLHHQDDEASL